MVPKFDDDRHVGFLSADISRLMRTEFDRQVSVLGVTRAQWMVLARLARRPGCLRGQHAARELQRESRGHKKAAASVRDNGREVPNGCKTPQPKKARNWTCRT